MRDEFVGWAKSPRDRHPLAQRQSAILPTRSASETGSPVRVGDGEDAVAHPTALKGEKERRRSAMDHKKIRRHPQ
jgi:hypothetical protein